MTTGYAYILADPLWPPVLHEVRGEDPETGLVIVSPCNDPGRVVFLYPEELWIVA